MKNPGIPSSVLIGTIPYRISTDPVEWERWGKAGHYGCTDSTKSLIQVAPECPQPVQRLTLWHEVLHALFETVMGAPDWKRLGKTQADREEAVIRRLEHGTLAVLRDNPDLVAYLTGD